MALDSQGMVGVLRVSHAGLQALAAHCEAVSSSLVALSPRPSAGLPAQATSNAVGTAYTALGRAITVMAARGQTTRVKASKAGATFAVSDDATARELAAIGGSMARTGTSAGV